MNSSDTPSNQTETSLVSPSFPVTPTVYFGIGGEYRILLLYDVYCLAHKPYAKISFGKAAPWLFIARGIVS